MEPHFLPIMYDKLPDKSRAATGVWAGIKAAARGGRPRAKPFCKAENTKPCYLLFSCFLLKLKALIRLRQKAKMHVIVLASQKGGAGKTTLAAHIAVAVEAAGDGPAVLIDADPQGSLSAWWNVREAQRPALAPTTIAELPAKLAALAEAGFAVAVVDTPPAITEAIGAVLRSADFVLIPTRPSPHDLRAVGSTVELVQAAGKPFVFAVTQAKANARLTVQAVAALSEHGVVAPAIVHDRVDYAGSMIDGRTVQETDQKGRSAGEMAELWQFVKAQMAKSTKARKELEGVNEQEARRRTVG
jgi:chromosome partitioning protein